MSTDVSEVRAASIIRAMIMVLMMEAARTSETSVDIQLRIRQYIPEDSELHTRRREILKFQYSWFPSRDFNPGLPNTKQESSQFGHDIRSFAFDSVVNNGGGDVFQLDFSKCDCV
jgi:hypothetical protein